MFDWNWNFRLGSYIAKSIGGTSLAAQWLRVCPSSTGAVGSSPGWRTKIPYAGQHHQKKNFLKSIGPMYKP